MHQVKKPEDRKPHKDPTIPPSYTEADVQALRAMARGQASPDQQKRALDYIVEHVCVTNDIAYRPSDRDTLVALGKTIVGRHLIWLLKVAPVQTDPAQRAAHYEGENQ